MLLDFKMIMEGNSYYFYIILNKALIYLLINSFNKFFENNKKRNL